MKNDGLVEIVLARDYAENKAGETIRRSAGRVAWLRANGFEAVGEPPGSEATPKPKRPPKGKPQPEPEAEPEVPPEIPPVAEGDSDG